jgi:hypothetical protein
MCTQESEGDVISVGVRELREDLSKLLQRVRDDGEMIEIMVGPIVRTNYSRGRVSIRAPYARR